MKTRILLASMVIVCLAAGGANSVQGAGIQDGLFEFDGTSPYWQFEGDVTRIDAGDATYLWMEEVYFITDSGGTATRPTPGRGRRAAASIRTSPCRLTSAI
jgi:predicted small secreted protein